MLDDLRYQGTSIAPGVQTNRRQRAERDQASRPMRIDSGLPDIVREPRGEPGEPLSPREKPLPLPKERYEACKAHSTMPKFSKFF